jgi:hypothetical protein
MAPRTVKLADLRTATEAAVRIAVGRKLPGAPGVLVGFWVDRATLKELKRTPAQIARSVGNQVYIATGIRVRPGVRPGGGGVTVGYIVPKVWNIRP